MHLWLRIEPETRIALVACSGRLGLEDAKQGASAVWSDPAWSGRAVVWDLRSAEFDVSTPEIRAIAEFVLEHQPSTPPAKLAFVTGRDLEFGLTRMYEVFRDHPATRMRVFRDHDAAVAWARSAGADGA